MDSAKLNDELQILGMLGIIASLIFVGMQLKQTDEIASIEGQAGPLIQGQARSGLVESFKKRQRVTADNEFMHPVLDRLKWQQIAS